MRARDSFLNGWTTATAITRTCDTLPPAAGFVTPGDTATETHVSGTFNLATSFLDAGSGLAACEYCKATDGTCDTEWLTASIVGNTCRATGLTCAHDDLLTLNMRATDSTANTVEAIATMRTCDTSIPPASGLVISNTDDGAHVDGNFDLLATFADPGSGLVSCDYCRSTDGSCDTEWSPATFSTGTCLATALTCTDNDALTLSMHGFDDVGNVRTTFVNRTCDGAPPQVTGIAAPTPATASYVPGTFAVTANLSDAAAGVASCDVCVSVDSSCDTEWVAGAIVAGTCQGVGLTCTDAAALMLRVRAIDKVGNIAISDALNGCAPQAIAVGDFNGDRIPDLVLAISDKKRLDVLAGNGSGGQGDGTYTGPTSTPVPGNAREVQIADLNRDGIQDLVIAQQGDGPNGVVTLFGNGTSAKGDATFAAPVRHDTGYPGEALTVADFNSDSVLDIAMTTSGSTGVVVLLGAGPGTIPDGTFSDPTIASAEVTDVNRVTLGDFNADNILDVVAIDNTHSAAEIWLGGGNNGRGDGTFSSIGSFSTPSQPRRVASIDLTGDHILDLIIESDSQLATFDGQGSNGRGNGTFTVGFGPVPFTGTAVGDINSDGLLDLVGVDRFGQAGVMFGNGNVQ